MQGLAALLVLALDAGGAYLGPPELRDAALLAAERQVFPAPVARATGAREADGAPPPCLGDVCQPQVSVPGYDPQYSLVGARTRLTVQALDAVHFEPVATVVWWFAVTGVRLDYTPAALDAALNGGVGVAHIQVLLRWRIDAFCGPAWMKRGR